MLKFSLNAKVLLLGTLLGVVVAALTGILHLAGLQRTTIGLSLLAAAVLVTLTLFLWFIHRYITRRVCLMASAVVRLTDGDGVTSRLPELGCDEIGTLAEKFNLLMERNREMTANLERLVAARTAELQAANQALRLSGEVFEHVLESIIITDRQGLIIQVNPAFETVTGFSRDEAVGRKANLVKSDRHPPEFYTEMWQRLTTVGTWQGEIWNRRKDGEIYPAMLSITSVRNAAGEITHYVGTLEDISLNKLNEERIRYLAFHDPLTGLANRVLFADRTTTGLQRARRDQGLLAVMVLDLDGFKQINDSHGHAVGDLLLIEVARRLRGVLRAEDTVARFGGDEFTALLPEVETPADALTVAEKILAAIAQPVAVEDRLLLVSASIGISVFPQDGDSYQALFEAADAAMYRVKNSGKAGYRLASAGK